MALWEIIKKYKKSTNPIVPKAPFNHLVWEIVDEVSNTVIHIQSTTLDALQDAIEDLATSLFQDDILCHINAKRVTPLNTLDLGLPM